MDLKKEEDFEARLILSEVKTQCERKEERGRRKKKTRKNDKRNSCLFPFSFIASLLVFDLIIFFPFFLFFSHFGFSPRVIIAVGAGSAWGFYFLFYNSGKSFLQGGDPKLQLSPAAHLATASMVGGEIFRCMRSVGERGHSWSLLTLPSSLNLALANDQRNIRPKI